MKITKRQLRRIIKEEKAKLLNEIADAYFPAADQDAELKGLLDVIRDLTKTSEDMNARMAEMGSRYGELTAMITDARSIRNQMNKLLSSYQEKLTDIGDRR